MKMSISIMMYPARSEFLPYLKERLGDVPVAMDDGVGLIQNCRNAWAMYDPTADYHCVIQDDAIVCDDFYNRAIAYLEKANGLPVSFFYSMSKFYKKFKQEREETGAICKKALYGGVAICLPVDLIPAMLLHYDADHVPMDDHRIGRFLLSIDKNIYCPFPCLIDHRVGNMSICNKDVSKTQASEYIDRK
jgi:hypothetical protein